MSRWPKVEHALDIDMIVAATGCVCAEMLRSGSTTFYDILEAPNATPEAPLAHKDVVERRGLRGLLRFETTERTGERVARLGLEENVRLTDSCEPGGLVDSVMCWHTTFTCSDYYIQEAFGLAADRDVLSHAHMNEGVHEGNWCLERTGRRTAVHYDHLHVSPVMVDGRWRVRDGEILNTDMDALKAVTKGQARRSWSNT